jgi:1,4-alpha-glucan branching enzyme
VYTEHGVAAFARDIEPARQVWSSVAGYPGDPAYREFYRDIGWDLPQDYVAPIIDPDGTRMFTGLKYYRITDRASTHREPYHPGLARQRADDHAGHFFDSRVADAHRLSGAYGRPPVIVCPYDAELYGHWWFEGPWFLELLFRKLAFDQDVLAAMTPSDVLERWPEQEAVSMAPSTWGAGGYFEVWLTHANEWCMPHVIGVGERLVHLLREHHGRAPFVDRVLRQAAREVMLAQSSDWPFLMSTGTAVDYARRRFIEHVQRFNRLDQMLTTGQLDEEFVALCERRDGLFPSLDLTDFV